jgi:hypothetical protein
MSPTGRVGHVADRGDAALVQHRTIAALPATTAVGQVWNLSAVVRITEPDYT